MEVEKSRLRKPKKASASQPVSWVKNHSNIFNKQVDFMSQYEKFMCEIEKWHRNEID